MKTRNKAKSQWEESCVCLRKENMSLAQKVYELQNLVNDFRKKEEAAAGPHHILHYIGGPFGDRQEKVPQGRGYFMLGQTQITVERLVWQVVAMDDSDPKERKVTLQFMGRDTQQ